MTDWHIDAAAICARYGFRLAAVLSSSRMIPLPWVRGEIAEMLRGRGLSYPQVGRLMGGRDHTTIFLLIAPETRRVHRRRLAAWAMKNVPGWTAPEPRTEPDDDDWRVIRALLEEGASLREIAARLSADGVSMSDRDLDRLLWRRMGKDYQDMEAAS